MIKALLSTARLLLGLCLLVPATLSLAEETQTRSAGASPLQARLDWEQRTLDNPFTLTSHKPTYVLPLTYNASPNNAPFQGSNTAPLERLEMKFQISIKFLAWRNILGDNSHLFFGYTQQSYWQAYYSDNSSPFRETNHEPEAILFFANDRQILGFHNRINLVGLSHQSNGLSEPLSRSWNRFYVDFIFEREFLTVSLKPWWRIPEDDDNDDNPDIDDYLGHGELGLVYKLGKHNLGMMLRHNFDARGRGAVQLDWSFPIYHDRLNGYLQYFNGYGESLIDYNDSSHRFGIGLILADWI